MTRSNYIQLIAKLSESEGIFTTAQAARFGIPRDAMHDAYQSNRLERIFHGAYRMTGTNASRSDELIAAWKLTAPHTFTHERLSASSWDGIVVGGASASNLFEFGNLNLAPYYIYTPKRINTRQSVIKFVKRTISRNDTIFMHGVLATRPERTIYDLLLDNEDHSLVAQVLKDAWQSNRNFNFARLMQFLQNSFSEPTARNIFQELLVHADLYEKVTCYDIRKPCRA